MKRPLRRWRPGVSKRLCYLTEQVRTSDNVVWTLDSKQRTRVDSVSTCPRIVFNSAASWNEYACYVLIDSMHDSFRKSNHRLVRPYLGSQWAGCSWGTGCGSGTSQRYPCPLGSRWIGAARAVARRRSGSGQAPKRSCMACWLACHTHTMVSVWHRDAGHILSDKYLCSSVAPPTVPPVLIWSKSGRETTRSRGLQLPRSTSPRIILRTGPCRSALVGVRVSLVA